MVKTETLTTIAIVEPDEASRVSLTRLLHAHGYHALSFNTVADYVVHARETGQAPLVLIDVQAFLNMLAVQRKAVFGSSRVITIGNGVRLKEISQALVAGCIDYFVRPVPSTLLLATLAQAINRIQLQ